VSAQLIEAAAIERHEALHREFLLGAMLACWSLYQIRHEATYHAAGHDSFKAYLASVGLTETNGRRMASLGRLAKALADEGLVVRHPDVLRPIANMLNEKQSEEVQSGVVRRQMGIVRSALNIAKREAVQLQERHVAHAAKSVGWLSQTEYRKRRAQELNAPQQRELDEVEQRAKLRLDVELALSAFLGCRRSGFELFTELGAPPTMVAEVIEVLNDWRDSA
jgi:hypothetical protein